MLETEVWNLLSIAAGIAEQWDVLEVLLWGEGSKLMQDALCLPGSL